MFEKAREENGRCDQTGPSSASSDRVGGASKGTVEGPEDRANDPETRGAQQENRANGATVAAVKNNSPELDGSTCRADTSAKSGGKSQKRKKRITFSGR